MKPKLPFHEKLGLLLVGVLMFIITAFGSLYVWFLLLRAMTPY